MGGPKDRLRIRGKPILVDLMDRLAWVGPTVLVVSPRRAQVDGTERFGRVVADPVVGEGPLRGVLTALEACGTEWTVVVPLDMTGIRREQVEWMLGRVKEKRGARCVMMSREERLEPFPLLVGRGMIGTVRGMLERGERSVRALAEERMARVLIAPAEWDPRVWMNVNTPGDAVEADMNRSL